MNKCVYFKKGVLYTIKCLKHFSSFYAYCTKKLNFNCVYKFRRIQKVSCDVKEYIDRKNRPVPYKIIYFVHDISLLMWGGGGIFPYPYQDHHLSRAVMTGGGGIRPLFETWIRVRPHLINRNQNTWIRIRNPDQ